MSNCCMLPHTGDTPACPMNGQLTKPVPKKTVVSLLKPEFKNGLTSQPYYFCDAPDCDVVYVSALGDHLIAKNMLAVRVGIKETEDPIPLCYCFGYDRQAIRDDIRRTGDTQIQNLITQRLRAGECRCEEMNPSGGCCLGVVAKTIKQARVMKEQGAL
ncbi:hypothetical protein KJ068_00925 [bacterium]|nr:hypothetical protein [bacterium]